MTISSEQFPHTLIRASAGTGKTFQLSNRYLGLAGAGVSLDEILATTFTRKAAGEIQQRVLTRLAEAADKNEKARELAEHLGDEGFNSTKARQVLEALVHQLHRLRISTLDAFFAQLARSFDLELGLAPGWRIIDETVDRRLRDAAVQAVLATGDTSDALMLLHLLTKGEATRSVTEQLQTLVSDLYALYQQTAADAWQSIDRPPRLPAEKLAAALDALSQCTLPRHKKIAEARDKNLADALAGDWASFIENGIAYRVLCEETDYYKKPITGEVQEVYRALLKHAAGMLVGQLVERNEAARKFLEAFDAEYSRLKLARRALRFDDITLALGKATLLDGARRLAFRLDAQIDHVLFDEFQDTSLEQWQVLRPLVAAVMGQRGGRERNSSVGNALRGIPPSVGNALRGIPPNAEGESTPLPRNATECVPYRDHATECVPYRDHATEGVPYGQHATAHGSYGEHATEGGSFFCVGDAKQAIYGWRGGVAELFDSLSKDWPGLDEPVLACSRRSSQPIVDTVNRVFDQIEQNSVLDERKDAASQWRRNYEPHTTAKQELAGYARLVTAPAGDTTEEQKTQTLAFAAKEIVRLVRSAPGRSVGVLVRNNDAIATLIPALGREGVSASEEGGNPLTDSPAVLIVLSLLTLADHPGDTVARYHVAHSPLGPAEGLVNFKNDRQAERLSLSVRQRLLARGYGHTIYGWARKLTENCGPRDASRLLQLVELAYRYEAEAGLRTRDFIERVRSEHVEAPSPADVRVMTIHKSKGLEFDIVVLPQLDVELCGQSPPVLVGRPEAVAAVDFICRYPNEALRRLLPQKARDAFERYSNQQIRESLCVLYVALTRAIHALHIIIAPSKASEKKLPSTFAGLLRSALTSGDRAQAEEVLYEHGDPQWHAAQVSAAPSRTSTDDAERSAAFKVALAQMPKQRRRGLDRESPSARAHTAKVELATLMALDDGRAVNRGSAFHAWFEQIEWIDDAVPDDATLRSIGVRVGASPADLQEWLAQFRAKLANPRLRSVLTRGTYLTASSAPWLGRAEICAELAGGPPVLEVFRERPFAVRLRDTLLSGTFDRLVLVRSQPEKSAPFSSGGKVAVKQRAKAVTATSAGTLVAAEVLDFKTDAMPPGDPLAVEKIVDRYRPQLSAYREAVCNMFALPEDRVITRLVLLEADAVVEVLG